MKKYLFSTLLIALLAAFPSLGANISGAIFTTTVDGSVVNANTQYGSKCDVYLDGGPGPNAPARAAGLPAGDYYFQVTDPNGRTLLSTGPVSSRRFTVSSNGVIVTYSGVGGLPHPTGVDQDHSAQGAITIRLANTSCPSDFLDSPNNGGVYKAWVTPVGDFVGDPTKVDNPCSGGCFHGFIASKSKTDNFKVRPTATTFCLTVVKQLILTSGELAIGAGWEIRVTDSQGVTNPYFTDATLGQVVICDLAPGSYTVQEIMQPTWQVSAVIVNGVALPFADTSYSFTWSAGHPAPVIVFRNELGDQ